MHTQTRLFIFLIVALAVLMLLTTGLTIAKGGQLSLLAPQAPIETGFTYQGQLTDGESLATGTFDLQFELYDAETGGSQLGTVTIDNVSVEKGIFTVTLDFGSESFDGSARWLAISVRPGDETGAFTLLTPRQALTAVPYAINASTLDGRPGSDYQVRISNTPKENIQNELGSRNTNIFSHNSVTIGDDGLPLISYYESKNGDLLVAHCEDLTCSSAITTTLDSTGFVGLYNAITIGTDGLGLISYHDGTNKDLKVAHCENVLCSNATVFTIDSNNDVGESTSITIGTDGLGLISYYDRTNENLKVAHCQDIQCSTATPFTIDNNAGDVGFFSSIALGADGLGLISYYLSTGGDLKVAHCDNVICSTASTYVLDSTDNVGHDTSITIGADGLGLISYYDWTNSALKVARCIDALCSSALTYSLDTGNVGHYSSIMIGMDGMGLISYYDEGNQDLKVAHCTTHFCNNAVSHNLNIDGSVASHSSITLGADGLPFISFSASSPSDLAMLHCANAFCVSNFRRR